LAYTPAELAAVKAAVILLFCVVFTLLAKANVPLAYVKAALAVLNALLTYPLKSWLFNVIT